MFFSKSLLCAAALFFSQGLVTATVDTRKETAVTKKERFGGNHGKPFDDIAFATTNHKRIAAVHMTGCTSDSHITKLDIAFRDNLDPDGRIVWARHGGYSEQLQAVVLDLQKDEYITRVAVTSYRAKTGHWWPYDYKTRIGTISLWTNKQQYKTCGASNGKDKHQDWNEENKALLYFSGTSGDMIDSLSTNWIPKADF